VVTSSVPGTILSQAVSIANWYGTDEEVKMISLCTGQQQPQTSTELAITGTCSRKPTRQLDKERIKKAIKGTTGYDMDLSEERISMPSDCDMDAG